MPILANPKHELFAQELAKGRTIYEAYVIAGYRLHRGNASALRTNQHVLDRLAELQSRSAKRAEVSIDSLSAELEEARKIAIEHKQPAAAVSATLGKAKLHGLLIEKRHHTGVIGTYDLTKVPDDQLDQLEAILGPLADDSGDQGREGAPAD